MFFSLRCHEIVNVEKWGFITTHFKNTDQQSTLTYEDERPIFTPINCLKKKNRMRNNFKELLKI